MILSPVYIRASVCMTIYYTLWNSDPIILDYVEKYSDQCKSLSHSRESFPIDRFMYNSILKTPGVI
jgi:hypothetical protein